MGNVLPTMPQFRNSDGSMNWPQWADALIPGNVYDSHTNQYRPRGMVAGGASMLYGPLAGMAVEATPEGAGAALGRGARGIGRGISNAAHAIGGLFHRDSSAPAPVRPQFSGDSGYSSTFFGNPRGYHSPFAGTPANQWGPQTPTAYGDLMSSVSQGASNTPGATSTQDWLNQNNGGAPVGGAAARNSMLMQTLGSDVALRQYMAAQQRRAQQEQ